MPKLSFQYVRLTAVETLLEFLTRRFMYHTAGEWEELIAREYVKVNGKGVEPGHILETRHKIIFHPPNVPEPEIDPTFTVVFEDDHLLAVSKSGNIPTSPSGKYWHNCLVHLLQRELGQKQLRAVHRLDRETSGINLFAKGRKTAGLLGRMFQEGAVRKEYMTILAGHLPLREIFVDAPLGGASEGAIRIKQVVRAGGRDCRTGFSLLAVLPGASLVRVVPHTGRTHQIRAHAAYIGHPVLGDRLYGAPEEEFIRWVGKERHGRNERQLLHAAALTINHPFSGRPITFRAPADELMELFYSRASE